AQKLQQERAFPVKIMNWGYWGSVGVVADESHNKIMARMGIGSIEPDEGMTSLQALVSAAVPQMALVKTLRKETESSRSAKPTMQIRSDDIQQVIVDKLSNALRMDAATIPGDAPLADYGVDSIIGVNLVRTLNEALNIELEPTKLFEYSTVDQLAQYIATLSPER